MNKNMELITLILEQVQMSTLAKDDKLVSDALLLYPAEEIASRYELEKLLPNFCIQSFFFNNFKFSDNEGNKFCADSARSPIEHIEALWPYLHRRSDTSELSTKISLPYPYVVPGGRFREIYYWDSYFTQLGLMASGRFDWIEHQLDNFSYLIEKFGHVPNGNRTYFLSRSQPPFFAHMVDSFANGIPSRRSEIFEKYLPSLLNEYSYWTMPNRSFGSLSHYRDDLDVPRTEMYRTDMEWKIPASRRPQFYRHMRAACESGWDFSSRWLADSYNLSSIRTLDIIPVDLNSLLLFYETMLSELTGDNRFLNAASRRKDEIQSLLFARESGFHDYDYKNGKLITEIHSAAALFPLFVHAATDDQARVVAAQVKSHLLREGGITATNIRSGQQWDSPNGWAPLHWVAVCGLRNYGYDDLAESIARRWINTCEKTYYKLGKFVEKYNVESDSEGASNGEYKTQDGFGWTNGVYLALKSLYPTAPT